MRRGSVLRSSHFQLAALCSILFVLTTSAILSVVFFRVREQTLRQVDDALAVESAILRTEFDRIGPAAFSEHIGELTDRFLPQRSLVILITSGGVQVPDSYSGLPSNIAGLRTLELGESGRPPESVRVLASRLGDGSTLVVGYERWPVDRAVQTLGETLVFSGGGAAALAIVLGSILARRAGRRVDAAVRACARVMDGQMRERLPDYGSGDEYDRLAVTVNAMLSRLEDLMLGIRRVSAGIAHDLRTPIARLRQRLEMARLRGSSQREIDAALDGAIAETDSILSTFASLLRIAQIEHRSRYSGFAAFDLVGRLKTLAETYGAVAEERGGSLAAELPETCIMTGDPDLVAQATTNLLENALRHAGGMDVRLSLVCGDREVEIAVADRGVGVPRDERERVLDPFYRLDRSRSTPGSGLGLSLVAAVARLHGGEVRLEDNAPGLRAALRLPRVVAGQTAAPLTPRIASGA